jgi:Trk K+ transport system NAD-binding subunit
MAKTFNDHVILCGLGRVGLRILEQLLHLGEHVIVLEKDPDNHNIVFARKNGVPVRMGAGREEGILDELNVQQAKSIILATDDDLANLELAMDARKANPEIRVVLRMFDQELAAKIQESFGIQLAFSTAALAAPLFATSSSDGTIENSFYVGDQLLVVASLTVNPHSELVGKTIGDFGSEFRIFFLSHTRSGEPTHFPAANTTFQPHDRIVVQAEPKTLKRLHQLNRDA